MKYVNLILMFLFIFACSGKETGQMKSNEPSVIPRPLEMKSLEGAFRLSGRTQILLQADENILVDMADVLQQNLESCTGIKTTIAKLRMPDSSGNTIVLMVLPMSGKRHAEAYELDVTPRAVFIRGRPAGLFYGIQTFLQLLPGQSSRSSQQQSVNTMEVPCARIKDQPRFAWRGMHLDVSRHFMPKEFILKFIDMMAMHKLNILHWHLTDDQGWRIEIKRYPRLTKVGAWRADRSGLSWEEIEPQKSGEPATYGGYYTQQDIRDIVAYAGSRFVTIIPEIEMPGHSLAALAAYPAYSCTGGPFSVGTGPVSIEDNHVFCAGNDGTFEFLQNILSEVMDLFPGPYLHIGGDECTKNRWKVCPKCQRRIQNEKLADEFELQSYFIRRIEKFVMANHKKLIGWDEILQGGLAPNAAVMSWRDMTGGAEAARLGHDAVMTPNMFTYFNNLQAGPDGEPEAGGTILSLEKVYSFDPIPAGLNDQQRVHIIGAQACLWSEYLYNTGLVEYMAFPRECALAEVVWTADSLRDFNDFKNRMAVHYQRLDAADINYRQPDIEGFNTKNVFVEKRQEYAAGPV